MTKAMLYRTKNNLSQRKVREFLEYYSIEYTERNMQHDPLTWEEFIEILGMTEYGLSEIISERSMEYKKLMTRGLAHMDDMTLKQVYKLVEKYPTLLRSPIVVLGNKLQVGYNEEDIYSLVPRGVRKMQMNKIVEDSDGKLLECDKIENIEGDYEADRECEAC